MANAAAKHRSHGAGARTRRRPDADRATLGCSGKGLPQNGKTVRHQHCRADPLHKPAQQHHDEVRRQRTSDRGDREQRDTHDQKPPPAETVAGGPAQQQQRTQWQQISIDEPWQRDGVS
jgi:hypothetical protein